MGETHTKNKQKLQYHLSIFREIEDDWCFPYSKCEYRGRSISVGPRSRYIFVVKVQERARIRKSKIWLCNVQLEDKNNKIRVTIEYVNNIRQKQYKSIFRISTRFLANSLLYVQALIVYHISLKFIQFCTISYLIIWKTI